MLIKTKPGIEVPKRATEKSAGLDLRADLRERPEFYLTTGGRYDQQGLVAVIPPGGTALIPTGISVVIPSGHLAFVVARSGISLKHGLRPANCIGTIDEDYPGEIKISLHNESSIAQKISHGDRIAQLVVMPVSYCNVMQVDDESFEIAHSEKNSSRNSNGFGSTGSR